MADDERTTGYDEIEANVAEMEPNEESGVKHVSDFSTIEEIHEALGHLDFAEAMGYDRETAEEFRQMAGSTSYGAADIEERLAADSPARILLAEGYRVAFVENSDGNLQVNYPMIQQAMTDITEAISQMRFNDAEATQQAFMRYADALMQREIKAIEAALANWSSTNGDARAIMEVSFQWHSTAQQLSRAMLDTLMGMEATRHHQNINATESENMAERTVLIARQAELRAHLTHLQANWYAFNASTLIGINHRNEADPPESVRQLMSELNYRYNRVLPEEDVAAYALEEAGIMSALDYLRDQAHHDLAESILDESITTEKVLAIVMNLNDMPKALADAQFGGDSSQLTGVEDPQPTYEAFYEGIRVEARSIIEEAKASGNAQSMVEAIKQVQDLSARIRLDTFQATTRMAS